jgi:hypothetical protein
MDLLGLFNCHNTHIHIHVHVNHKETCTIRTCIERNGTKAYLWGAQLGLLTLPPALTCLASLHLFWVRLM